MFISNDNPRFDRAELQIFTSGGVEQASLALIGDRGCAGRVFIENVPMAQTIEDALNGNVQGLAERIEEALSDANDMDVTFADFALHVACNLIGKDVDEAYRERREAKEAAA